jgi:hypothetical protein
VQELVGVHFSKAERIRVSSWIICRSTRPAPFIKPFRLLKTDAFLNRLAFRYVPKHGS